MKFLNMFTLILCGAIAVSCQDFLNVDPKTEVKEDKLFENEQGFKDAIIGSYLLMTHTSVYGKELTSGFLEPAAQQFATSALANNPYYESLIWNWDNQTIRGYIDQLWEKMYNTVANVNNIIQNIDEREHVLHPTNYRIIKGEAYGLRGFLHFELLRLFGYGDLIRHPEYMDRMTIPYSRSYNKVFADQYTQKEVIRMAIEDLETAIELLESYDPWAPGHKPSDYTLPNSDGFYKNRSTRFNYWAAKATPARIYMWTGEYDQALSVVRHFLDSRSAVDGLRWMNDSDIPDQGDPDLTFSMEHIFRLDVNKLWENIRINYDPAYAGGDENVFLFYIPDAEELFEKEIGHSDYRYRLQLNLDNDKVTVKKYKDSEHYNFPNRVPLIKMAEIYYMAAECLCEAGETAEAVKLLNEVRQNRNIAEEFRIDENASAEVVREEILKEWRKEFLSEGQIFYYYKRTGASVMGKATVKDPVKVYVLAIPEDEIHTGGREKNIPETQNE